MTYFYYGNVSLHMLFRLKYLCKFYELSFLEMCGRHRNTAYSHLAHVNYIRQYIVDWSPSVQRKQLPVYLQALNFFSTIMVLWLFIDALLDHSVDLRDRIWISVLSFPISMCWVFLTSYSLNQFIGWSSYYWIIWLGLLSYTFLPIYSVAQTPIQYNI